MPRLKACILFPSTWTKRRIRSNVERIETADIELTHSSGNTDAPCIDTVPMGREEEVRRLIV